MNSSHSQENIKKIKAKGTVQTKQFSQRVSGGSPSQETGGAAKTGGQEEKEQTGHMQQGNIFKHHQQQLNVNDLSSSIKAEL